MAVWNVVQKLGSKIQEKQERKILLNKKGQLDGSKEVNVLFQEADTIWLSIQGKDSTKRRKSKKKELKIGITYEGWKKRNDSKDAYNELIKGAVKLIKIDLVKEETLLI